MTNLPVIETGDWPGFARRTVPGPAGPLSVRVGGPADAPAALFNHSILTSSAIWRRQAALLVEAGYRVLCPDLRGHGRSAAWPAPYEMDDLVADDIAVLDAFGIERVHQVGVSLGGMIGFGLGVRHLDRLLSLYVVAARADAPPSFAAAWDDRIALAEEEGIAPLAGPTAERWFGRAFLDARPDLAESLGTCIRETSTEGFIGCARAIQGLDYLDGVADITVPTDLVVGARDELLRQPMEDLTPLIRDATFTVIEDAGHLPQIDRPDETDALLLRHIARCS
jgi:3-oxoadipate enol-lactonase